MHLEAVVQLFGEEVLAVSVEARADALGRRIRAKKGALHTAGYSYADANAAVTDEVLSLQALKARLPPDSALSHEAFERQKRDQEAAKAAAVREEKARQAARRKAAQATLEVPLVQRKIFHLFAFTGQGDTFRYRSPNEEEFGLNTEQVAFDPRRPAVLTLKWDGTTVQATRDAVWRRQDMRWSKSGPRYVLILVCWYENGEWIGLDDADVDPNMASCVREALPALRRLPPGICIYFEACSPAINATYKNAAMAPTVRVFDSSEGNHFRPFDATAQLADEIGLPHVGVLSTLPECTADAAWAELQRAQTLGYPDLPNSALEGFVARQGDAIAKARVEYCGK